jgi:hypothetical protein
VQAIASGLPEPRICLIAEVQDGLLGKVKQKHLLNGATS